MASDSRLRKSPNDKMLFGVAGGLADYFDIDPTIVRVAFVISCLFGGLGLLMYLALAVIMPSSEAPARDSGEAGPPTIEQRRRRGLAALLIVLGLALFVGNAGVFSAVNWGLAFPVALVVVGVVLFRRRSARG